MACILNVRMINEGYGKIRRTNSHCYRIKQRHIRKAVALALVAEGANITINYNRGKERGEKIADEIRRQGGKAIAIGANVSKEEEVRYLFTQTINQFGTVDILVNNSGIQRDNKLVDMTLEEWQNVIQVGLTGSFLCSRAAVREFLKRGIIPDRSRDAGKIIFITSVHEKIPWAGHCNYAAAKGGMMMLMKTLSLELAEYKIRINSVAPGAIKTDINKDTWQNDDKRNALINLIPNNEIGTVDDVSKAVTWLVSDEAHYINGTTLFIDGGMSLYPGFATGG